MVQGGSRTYDDAVTQGGGAERSTAIVLFTDMVGSTELRSRLGENAADELRKGHDALVAGAVEANRGHVIKNLGDGVMATFSGASDAVGAAVAIQQAIGRRNRSKTAALELRIGISAGDVIFEGADCFGTPVIEAARLCGAAEGGQILASEMVRWLARSGEGTFTPIGNLELKGLPEPVAAVQVDWDLLAESLVPLPPFLTDIGRIFVGRDDELERLGQLWKEATAGELRVALLAGEPGVGKTRLAAELAGRVHDDGATVLAGRCDEDLGVPYQPFVEALRHYVDHAPAGLGLSGPLRRGAGPAGARADRAGSGSARPAPVRPGDRALSPLRCRGLLAGGRLSRGAHPARPRRSPVGGEADAVAAAPRRRAPAAGGSSSWARTGTRSSPTTIRSSNSSPTFGAKGLGSDCR